MPLTPGTRFGPYEIARPLGAGGMGEVYEARDTRLDRTVAIKVLPADLAQDEAARARFDREARAIAALNHPNICALHDIGDADGHGFLVMERLEGETLQQRLQRGPLEIDQVVEYGIAMADALDAAHERGLIHRDLKPANVFITTRGIVKILDFGLAKSVVDNDADVTRVDATVTVAGTTLGTIAYMSPEQLRGEPLDVRTDLFSLGLVMYEMATGQRPFSGPTIAVVAAGILGQQLPAPRTLRPEFPPRLEAVILKLTEKDRTQRYQTAAVLKSELMQVKQAGTAALVTATAAPATRASRVRALAFALMLVAFVAAAAWWGRSRPETPPTTRDVPEPVATAPDVPPVTPPPADALPAPPPLPPQSSRAAAPAKPDSATTTRATPEAAPAPSGDVAAGNAPVAGRGLRPRRGFGPGTATLVKMLRSAPPETYDLVFAANDPEAMSMALQLQTALANAGWTNASTVEIAQPQVKLGIFAPRASPGVSALTGWAVRLGLEPDIRRVATLKNVRIVIGKQQ